MQRHTALDSQPADCEDSPWSARYFGIVDHVNRELGDTTHEVDWKVSAPPPKP
jgi:hypothetical protein